MTTAQLNAMTAAELDNLETLAQELTTMIETATHEQTESAIELTEMLLTAYDDSELTGIDAYLIDRQRRHNKLLAYGCSTVKQLKDYVRAYMKPKSKWRKHELVLALIHLAVAGVDRAGHYNMLRQPIE